MHAVALITPVIEYEVLDITPENLLILSRFLHVPLLQLREDSTYPRLCRVSEAAAPAIAAKTAEAGVAGARYPWPV